MLEQELFDEALRLAEQERADEVEAHRQDQRERMAGVERSQEEARHAIQDAMGAVADVHLCGPWEKVLAQAQLIQSFMRKAGELRRRLHN